MLALRRRVLIEAAKLCDLVVMIFAFGIATIGAATASPEMPLAQFLSMRVKVQNFALFGCLLFVWQAIFSAFGLYDSKRLSTHPEEPLDTLKATSVSSLSLFVVGRLFQLVLVTPLFVAVFWAASTTMAVSDRFLIRLILQRVRSRGRNLRYMVVVGTNARAIRFAEKIQTHPELGYVLLGFVDDGWFGMGEFKKNGRKLISDLKGFLPFLREHVVDEVVIALPMESAYAQASRIASVCEEQGIVVRLLADLFDLRLARSTATEFEGDAVITLYTGSPESWQHLVKRPLDIALSLAAIVATAPVCALATLLIKLTSPGPVFFVQERVGLSKRKFRLFKFRTMVTDAEQKLAELEHLNEAGGPAFKIKNDPRITPVGKLLRKTSIDELPQLLNVLKGDMSLVGPRPLPVRDYNGFDQDWQRRRFSVRPGITCLWQVNGRSSVTFDKWMELDMEYIDHWSLVLDMKILAKTIPAVMRGVGAV